MISDTQPDDVLPAHPGDLMKSWFMDGKKLSAEYVAMEAHLPVRTIEGIIEGKVDIDRDTATALSKVFGKSAETLFRLQAEYNHFLRFKKIPSFDELPRL
ncbi:helix-turn-helix domain-containing protein [Methylobacterium sp. E-065]|uniref:helix-turn-helix transcriptional regulator n=1 Tax=Methylobacterium sp. E-065 TaxID=2836583 RepID=UPI001FBB99CE|nr:helix-turn-helix domain-containing protein [Methylobacterium sp. E-065]MCJ2015892.1 helix-turn-helix domain-containing protein [Methylobacterium sp. E-065]